MRKRMPAQAHHVLTKVVLRPNKDPLPVASVANFTFIYNCGFQLYLLFIANGMANRPRMSYIFMANREQQGQVFVGCF